MLCALVLSTVVLAVQDAAPAPDESNAATWYRCASEIRFSEDNQLFIGTELFVRNEWCMRDPARIARRA